MAHILRYIQKNIHHALDSEPVDDSATVSGCLSARDMLIGDVMAIFAGPIFFVDRNHSRFIQEVSMTMLRKLQEYLDAHHVEYQVFIVLV